jgi:hypothetical protein
MHNRRFATRIVRLSFIFLFFFAWQSRFAYEFPFSKLFHNFTMHAVSMKQQVHTKRNNILHFAKYTSRFAKVCFEAKHAVSHVSLFCIRNDTAHFTYFVTGTYTDVASLDDASLAIWYRYVPCTRRPLCDASLVRCVPCMMIPLYDASFVRCVPCTTPPL